MQELTFEQVEVVSGGLNLFENPTVARFDSADKNSTGGDNDGPTFWGEIGAGFGAAVASIGKGIENVSQAISDTTSSIKNWVDSRNIERMCKSGAVDSVEIDGMTVKCK
ncbi:hypothetical protein ACO1PK_04645 [Alishewanella sp. d11]|uniref:hypothetical protein n=1 Tax=Alishewanella sp. d11 TaxID=3414030 RepID=UPI003BF7868A